MLRLLAGCIGELVGTLDVAGMSALTPTFSPNGLSDFAGIVCQLQASILF
jgi:hypothetical protein